MMNESNTTWENMTLEEKKKELLLRQKKTLDLFLERNAISKAQYDKSLGDLVEKMGMRVVNWVLFFRILANFFHKFIDRK